MAVSPVVDTPYVREPPLRTLELGAVAVVRSLVEALAGSLAGLRQGPAFEEAAPAILAIKRTFQPSTIVSPGLQFVCAHTARVHALDCISSSSAPSITDLIAAACSV